MIFSINAVYNLFKVVYLQRKNMFSYGLFFDKLEDVGVTGFNRSKKIYQICLNI